MGFIELLNINDASKACGLSPSVLRIWELRYGWPNPSKTNNGYRGYSPELVKDLRRVGAIVRAGTPISYLVRDGIVVPPKPTPPPIFEADDDTRPVVKEPSSGHLGFTIMEPMSYNYSHTPAYRRWMAATSQYMHDKYRFNGAPPIFTGPCEVLIRSGESVHMDADNLIKPLLDAVTQGGIWTDDRLVMCLTVKKHAASVPIYLAIWRHEASE